MNGLTPKRLMNAYALRTCTRGNPVMQKVQQLMKQLERIHTERFLRVLFKKRFLNTVHTVVFSDYLASC